MLFRPPSWLLKLYIAQVFLSGDAWANTSATAASSTASGGATWYSLVTLTLLVVLVAVVLRVYKRMVGLGPSDPHLQILARQSLGAREQVVVVRIQDRYFALGYTPTQVNLIAELDEFTPSSAAAVAAPNGFSELLSKARLKDRQS